MNSKIEDRNHQPIQIGDVVRVYQPDFNPEWGVISNIYTAFTDPIEIKLGKEYTICRNSSEVELVSRDEAVLWKLENL